MPKRRLHLPEPELADALAGAIMERLSPSEKTEVFVGQMDITLQYSMERNEWYMTAEVETNIPFDSSADIPID